MATFLNTAFYTWDSWLSYAVSLIGPVMLAFSVWNSARITGRRKHLVDGIAERIERVYPSRDRALGVPKGDGTGELTLDDELHIIHQTMIDLGVTPADELFDRDAMMFMRRMLVRESLEITGKRGPLRKFISGTFTRRPPQTKVSRKPKP